MPTARVFISYAQEDAALLRELDTHLASLQRAGLVSAWHDRCVSPGADWRAEIDTHLQEAELILLLVSPDFIASDFCYLDVLERALLRHKTGEARVVPIILRPCAWRELSFGTLAHLPAGGAGSGSGSGSGSKDRSVSTEPNRDAVWLQIMEALRRLLPKEPVKAAPVAATSARPSLPLAAPGAAYESRSYVSRPGVERDAGVCLLQPGMPVLLRSPERMGKSQVVRHLLGKLREGAPELCLPGEAAPRVALFDLRILEDQAWVSAESFFRDLGGRLAQALDIPDRKVDSVFKNALLTPAARLEKLLIGAALPACAGRLVLAVDHIDVVADRGSAAAGFTQDFFSLLRSFMDRVAQNPEGPLSRLRLILSTAMDPVLLISDQHRSPFNIARKIDLGDLSAAQVAELAQRHGVDADEAALSALRELVGGHPYLSRLAIYHAWLNGQPLSSVLPAAAEGSLYDDHLRSVRARLIRAGLYEAARGVRDDPKQKLPVQQHEVLVRSGILAADIDRGGPSRGYRLRYPIYDRLFL